MSKHLVLVGGGHAHMTAMLHLKEIVDQGHQVTLISPNPYQYYSGMGPGLLGGFYSPQEVRFFIQKMVEDRGGRFVEDKAVSIEPEKRVISLGSGESVNYDVVSFNIGSEVPLEAFDQKAGDVFTVKPIRKLIDLQTRILERIKNEKVKAAVIGGGPAGVEIAGNLHRLIHNNNGVCEIDLFNGGAILTEFPARVRKLALESLSKRNIRVHEGIRINSIDNDKITAADNSEFPVDFVIVAVGTRPPRLFVDSGLPTGADGGLLIDRFLKCVEYPDIFGGGDCVTFQEFSLAKVGVYAVRQNPVLFHNLKATLNDESLLPFDPGGAYLLILNLGDDTGIFSKFGISFNGKCAFKIKDKIDKRFMHKFQVSGERHE